MPAADRLTSDAVLGGALGGALGAFVGAEIDGRPGAIVGSALGAAAGVLFALAAGLDLEEGSRQVLSVLSARVPDDGASTPGSRAAPPRPG